ncbi:myc-associated zinc finger protein isoform X2 [Seriola aureovittata]|uniref:myc-associated zinc finger protein isoform X2 n=1 Tax=Seriola aureovittata TaxID=2871759 RepID=UPI0024BEBE0E|nr:myc-associated zinc finger protein isoform X2 [Seriola aureovittata]
MDTSWSNFLFQTAPTQNQPETPLQSELLPELTGSAQSPPADHIVTPPSTVDTAALSEEPLPVKPLTKPTRPAHICATCNKEFKNSYNLRRHQSVHTGIKMKDRAAREKEDGAKGARLEKQTVPLSLLHLTLPPQPPPPPPPPPPTVTAPETLPQPGQHANQESQPVSVSIAPATVTMAAPPQPIQAAVVVVGSMEQNPNPTPTPNPNTNQVRKNHACEACGKAFRDVYHLNRHRLSHSDEKPYSCPICQQRFKRKDRMSYHVRSHQGGVEKPYICPHCAKAFSRPDHLNSHVRQVHSTERPFKCTVTSSSVCSTNMDVHVSVRHTRPSPCSSDPSRGEGAVSHLREAAVRRLHHRPHEGPQPIAAPRLSPLQPQLHHPHLSACPRSEAPRPGVEGERWCAGGFRWNGGRRGAALPAVWGAVQDGHAAPGSHGHPRQPGRPQPRPDQHGPPGHHQRGRHCVQREHSGTAGY